MERTLRCVLVLLFAVFTLVGNAFAEKSAVKDAGNEISHITYRVKDRDWLCKIVRKYFPWTTWQEIANANPEIKDHPDLIYPGNVLVIPSRNVREAKAYVEAGNGNAYAAAPARAYEAGIKVLPPRAGMPEVVPHVRETTVVATSGFIPLIDYGTTSLNAVRVADAPPRPAQRASSPPPIPPPSHPARATAHRNSAPAGLRAGGPPNRSSGNVASAKNPWIEPGRNVCGHDGRDCDWETKLGFPSEVVELLRIRVANDDSVQIHIVKGDRFDAMMYARNGKGRVALDVMAAWNDGHTELAREYAVTWHGKRYRLIRPYVCNNWSSIVEDAPVEVIRSTPPVSFQPREVTHEAILVQEIKLPAIRFGYRVAPERVPCPCKIGYRVLIHIPAKAGKEQP